MPKVKTPNLNDMAKRITDREGLKISLPIGQVKEVMRLTFTDLAGMTDAEVAAILR